MKFIFFIFFSFITTNVFSYPTLKKYGSVIGDGYYTVFESGDFSIGDKMYFEYSTEGYCSDRLYYQYYDDLESIVEKKPTYYTKCTSESLVSVNSRKVISKKYYTIEKKGGELDETDGKYLLLYCECLGQFEITNKESDGTTQIIIIIIIVICVFVVIIIVLAIVCACLYRKRRQMMMNQLNQLNQMPMNYVSPYGPYYQQQVFTYPQMANNQMIYQNPQPVILSPSNVQVIQNGGAPNTQSSEQLNTAPQTIEKPH